MTATQLRTDEAGFTFIEILVAVAILGISIVTLVGLEIRTIRLQQVANRTTIATLLAQEKLNETTREIIDNGTPSLYYDEGDFEEEYENYHWEYTLTATPADELYRIDFMTHWNPEDKEGNSVTLTTFIWVQSP